MYITEKHMNHTFHAWSINTFCKVNNYVWIILIYTKRLYLPNIKINQIKASLFM